MINQVLDYTKKYYPYSLDTGILNIVSDGIEGVTGTFLVGQYVNIQNSILNDGTYKITALNGDKLTLDATLLPENQATVLLWGLRLPQGLLSLITKITDYTDNQSVQSLGIKSEKQGNRSVSYGGAGGGAGSTDNTWLSVFRKDLELYKNLFDDRLSYCRRYNINTKGW